MGKCKRTNWASVIVFLGATTLLLSFLTFFVCVSIGLCGVYLPNWLFFIHYAIWGISASVMVIGMDNDKIYGPLGLGTRPMMS